MAETILFHYRLKKLANRLRRLKPIYVSEEENREAFRAAGGR